MLRLSCLLLLAFTRALFAQNAGELAVENIPAPLRAGAHVVVRLDECRLDISAAGRMKEQRRRIVTILDKKGLDYARFSLSYDQFRSIDEIRAECFDADGKAVKTFKRKEFIDRPIHLDNVEIARKSRYLSLDLSNLPPPFTLEYTWTVEHQGILDYPDLCPRPDFYLSVEKALYEISAAKGLDLRYHSGNGPAPQIRQNAGATVYSWRFERLPALPDEPYNLPAAAQSPFVGLTPGQFDMEGYRGSYDSWDGFARWNQQLLDALPALQPEVAAQIQKTFGHLPERERIKAIYQMVQNSTRYISIQLGIGGWQPFDPNFVHQKKYGDCKALSWYARSLLQAAGIRAFYTLIYRGDTAPGLDPAFPDYAFNHVILTIPDVGGDTLWLECTSQTDPLGYVGPDISNRKALVIDEGRGTLIQMPVFTTPDRVLTDSVCLTVAADMKTTDVRWTTTYSSPAINYYDGFLDAFHADAQAQKSWVEQNFNFKGRQLKSFTLHLDTLSGSLPTGRVELEAASTQLLNQTTNRLYFQPNFSRPWANTLLVDSIRVSPVLRENGYTYVLDFSMPVPAGWKPESLPQTTEIVSPFGAYRRNVHFSGEQLHYRRSIAMNPGIFPPEQYSELVAFFLKLKKLDEERAVFTR